MQEKREKFAPGIRLQNPSSTLIYEVGGSRGFLISDVLRFDLRREPVKLEKLQATPHLFTLIYTHLQAMTIILAGG